MISYKGHTGVFEYDETIDALAGHMVDIAGEITNMYCRAKIACRTAEKGREAVMHRIRSAGIRSAALPFLAVVWGWVVLGEPAFASDQSQGVATSLPAVGADSAGNVPYLSLGMSLIRSRDARFVDGEDAGHAALYGSEERFDAGAVDNGLRFHLAAGVRLPSEQRVQLEFGLARALDWRGNTNYRNSGEHQPSEARLDTRQLLLAGFHDFPGWALASGRRVRPFLGAGLGVTDYRLSGYVQRFPEPDDPRGYLRRGPGGEIPFTALPPGKRAELHLDADGRGCDTDPRRCPPRPELPIHRCGRGPDRYRRHRHRAVPRGRNPEGDPGPDQRDLRRLWNPLVARGAPVRFLAPPD